MWTALQDTDEDPNNPSNVILLYSGASQAKSTNGGGVDDWNREHVWAKSHGDFGTATGPGTDVHHLRPTDVSVNSTRGNKDFDDGGSPVAQAPGSLTDADSFEPRDADKGDVARMIFYMSVRYEGGDGFADLEADDGVTTGTAPRHGKLSVLLRWNAAGPAQRLRAAPQRADPRELAGQPQPVHRPPGVGGLDLGLRPYRPSSSHRPSETTSTAPSTTAMAVCSSIA